MFKDTRITIAEHDPDSCAALQRILEASGFEVRTARTVRDALELLPETDVLSLDWRLNSGVRYADVVLDEWVSAAGGPVVVLTDMANSKFRQDMLVRGAYNILERPVKLEVFQACMIRYGRMVRDRKALADLASKVKDLEAETGKRVQALEKRTKTLLIGIVTLAVIAAAYGGPVVIDKIASVIGALF